MRDFKFRAFNTIDKVMITDLNTPALFHGLLVPDADDIVMQYIGRKDKSGADIYESDLIYFSYDPDKEPWIVEWSTEDAAFIMREPISGAYTDSFNDDLVICGNIHENPEMLEKSE